MKKNEFARFLLEEEVLMFGDFTLKSGRKSPHFFNSGRFDNGRALNRLAFFMAEKLKELGGGDIVFGPAYKGIPLALSLAMRFDERYGGGMGFLFDRKEAKAHGDGGLFIGRLPKEGDRIVLVDDVISSGISLAGAVDLLKEHFNITPTFALVCVDRQEKGRETHLSARREFEEKTGLPCHALISLNEVLELMQGKKISGRVVIDEKLSLRVKTYLETYGTL
jgi:orotate phosphoribosyltransferase